MIVVTLKTLHHNNLSWNLIHSCLLQGLYLDPQRGGAHGHGLAVLLWENFWNLITDKNFHIHPKWGRLAEWITGYPSLATIITDSWLILFYLCPYPLFIHPTHPEFLRAFKGSHGILACGDINCSHSFLKTRRSCNLTVCAQPSKKEWTHFPRHSLCRLRVFCQSYKRVIFSVQNKVTHPARGVSYWGHTTPSSPTGSLTEHLCNHCVINLSLTLL